MVQHNYMTWLWNDVHNLCSTARVLKNYAFSYVYYVSSLNQYTKHLLSSRLTTARFTKRGS